MIPSDLFCLVGCYILVAFVFLAGVLFGRSKIAPQQTVIVFEATPKQLGKSEPQPDWFYSCFGGRLVVPLKSHVYAEKLAIVSGFLRSAERFRREVA